MNAKNIKIAALVTIVVLGTNMEIKNIRTKRAQRKAREFETFVASVNEMMNEQSATTDVTYVTVPTQ